MKTPARAPDQQFRRRLESGLRRGELLGLTWDRVDLSRGVLRLEVTKAGRRREVPMRQEVEKTERSAGPFSTTSAQSPTERVDFKGEVRATT